MMAGGAKTLLRGMTVLFLVTSGVFFVATLAASDRRAVVVALVITAALLVVSKPIWRRVDRLFMSIARRRALAVISIGGATLLLNASLGSFVHHPEPAVRDEFSYLLAHDTFANGRLTNPTHPLWEHFEAGHIIHQPTYQSKYPPGQGLALAFGQAFFGDPAVGVWVSIAIACSAITWTLQAWHPPRWAFLGGLLFMLNFDVFRFWGQSYWGGAVAATGGALLFGALPRITQVTSAKPSLLVKHVVLMGVGLTLLAYSRPFEGFVASLPAAAALFIWFARAQSLPSSTILANVAVPIVMVLMAAAAWLGYYNSKVTGNALRMPYQVWAEQQQLQMGRVLISAVDFAGESGINRWNGSDIPASILAERQVQINARRPAIKLLRQYVFYIGIPLAIPFFMLPCIVHDRRMQFAIVTCSVTLAAILMNHAGGFAHYTAPVAGLITVIAMQGLRILRLWRWHNRHVGVLLARGIAVFRALFARMSAIHEMDPQPGGNTDAVESRSRPGRKEATGEGWPASCHGPVCARSHLVSRMGVQPI